MTDHTCANCRHFVAPNECRRYPPNAELVFPATKPELSCGEWRGQSSRGFLVRYKFTDPELLAYLRSDEFAFCQSWPDSVSLVQDQFGVSRRTAEERLKKLIRREICRITGDEGETKMFSLRPEFLEESEDETPLEKAQVIEQRETLRPRTRYDWADIAPHLEANGPDAEHALNYSTLHQLCKPMGRGAFDRLLKGAVESGKAIKTDSGLYHAANP